MNTDASPEPPGSTFLLIGEDWKVACNLKDWVFPAVENLREELPSYGISRLYSKGGMGAVYQGHHRTLERVVAIKIMAPVLDDDPAFAKRFLAEARAMAGLCHPGIVTVHDAGKTPRGLLYYVMEFVEGADLSVILAAEGRMPMTRALSIVRQIGGALMAAHAAGIIHRDIKPSNVILDRQDVAKVTDFGLASSAYLDESAGTSPVMGTLEYMPPEARMGGFEVDARTDIYALGVMCFRMVMGQLPSGVEGPAPVPETVLGAILKRAMAGNPEARYQTVAAMMTDLDHLADRTARRIRHRRRGFAAGVLVVALAGVSLWMPGTPDRNGALTTRQLAHLIAAEPLPAGSISRQFPTGRWAGVRADRAQFPGLIEEPEGWQRLPETTILRPLQAKGLNWGIRVTFQEKHHSHPPGVILREADGKNYNACLVEGSRLFFSRSDPQATPSSTRLGELRLLKPLPPEVPYTLECFIIGRRLVCRTGTDILSLTLANPDGAGGMALHLAGQEAFRDLQFINLDGMREDQAEQLALGLPPHLTGIQWAAAAPVWTPVPLSPYVQAGVEVKENDGWFRLPGRKILQLHQTLVTDGGVRVTFEGRDQGPSPELNLRAGAGGNYNLFRTSTAMVVQQYLPSAPEGQRYRTLQTAILPRLEYGRPHTLELVAIGNRLRAKCGEVSCEVTLPSLESGTLALYGPDMDGFRDAAVIVCDGLTNADARRAVHWPQAP